MIIMVCENHEGIYDSDFYRNCPFCNKQMVISKKLTLEYAESEEKLLEIERNRLLKAYLPTEYFAKAWVKKSD